ncbi:HTH-type transcriptional regulator PrtR [Halomonadaceae bacterium LMG 33818]|uniref:XRE family transcriptional regulator n=1 Tax=Cernens ardua TaxID=3402176 RepID=UPI003EDBE1B1
MVSNDRQKWRDEFAARLRAALKQNAVPEHGSGAYLRRLTGVSGKAASKWLNGESVPGDDKIANIAQVLRVPIEWLRYGVGEVPDVLKVDQPNPSQPEVSGLAQPPVYVDLPVICEVACSSSNTQNKSASQVVESSDTSLTFSRAKLDRAGILPEQVALATVHGNAMVPTLTDGSSVAIDRKCNTIFDGKIYALDHGGMLRIKRLYKLPLNKLRLVSDNADEYPEEVVSLDNEEGLTILGRIFWWEVFD